MSLCSQHVSVARLMFQAMLKLSCKHSWAVAGTLCIHSRQHIAPVSHCIDLSTESGVRAFVLQSLHAPLEHEPNGAVEVQSNRQRPRGKNVPNPTALHTTTKRGCLMANKTDPAHSSIYIALLRTNTSQVTACTHRANELSQALPTSIRHDLHQPIRLKPEPSWASGCGTPRVAVSDGLSFSLQGQPTQRARKQAHRNTTTAVLDAGDLDRKATAAQPTSKDSTQSLHPPCDPSVAPSVRPRPEPNATPRRL